MFNSLGSALGNPGGGDPVAGFLGLPSLGDVAQGAASVVDGVGNAIGDAASSVGNALNPSNW